MGVAAQAGRRLETLAERLRVLLHPSRTAAARGAGSPAGIDLRASFASPELERDWRVISARIETLGLTPEAGASTVHLAAGLADAHGSAAAQRLLTVDIKDVNHAQNAAWRSFRLLQSPADAMRRLGYDRLVEFRVGRSTDVLREPGEGYDLIFLDGDHRLKTVAAEIPLALGRLRPGGFVLLHDFFPGLRPLWSDGKVIDGPQLAVSRLRRAGWPLDVLPLGELPWPTKLGSSRTSLALLGRAA